MGLEDPFDCTDNCARTIAPHASSSVANSFGTAVQAMLLIDSTTVPPDAQDEGAHVTAVLVLCHSFGHHACKTTPPIINLTVTCSLVM